MCVGLEFAGGMCDTVGHRGRKIGPDGKLRRITVLLSKWKGAGVALLVALMPLFSQAAQADRTYRFSLLHTNDEHGHFWFNEQGEYGLAAQ